jgi:hypothetical protein
LQACANNQKARHSHNKTSQTRQDKLGRTTRQDKTKRDETRRDETTKIKGKERKGKVEGDTGHKVFFVLPCMVKQNVQRMSLRESNISKKMNIQLLTLTLTSLTLLIALCYPQDFENGDNRNGVQMRLTVLFIYHIISLTL